MFVPSFTYVASAGRPLSWGRRLSLSMCWKTVLILTLPVLHKPLMKQMAKALGQPWLSQSICSYADIDAITKVAHAANIKVLVIGQSFGASSHGRKVGTMGDATTSFFRPSL